MHHLYALQDRAGLRRRQGPLQVIQHRQHRLGCLAQPLLPGILPGGSVAPAEIIKVRLNSLGQRQVLVPLLQRVLGPRLGSLLFRIPLGLLRFCVLFRLLFPGLFRRYLWLPGLLFLFRLILLATSSLPYRSESSSRFDIVLPIKDSTASTLLYCIRVGPITPMDPRLCPPIR